MNNQFRKLNNPQRDGNAGQYLALSITIPDIISAFNKEEGKN